MSPFQPSIRPGVTDVDVNPISANGRAVTDRTRMLAGGRFVGYTDTGIDHGPETLEDATVREVIAFARLQSSIFGTPYHAALRNAWSLCDVLRDEADSREDRIPAAFAAMSVVFHDHYGV